MAEENAQIRAEAVEELLKGLREYVANLRCGITNVTIGPPTLAEAALIYRLAGEIEARFLMPKEPFLEPVSWEIGEND